MCFTVLGSLNMDYVFSVDRLPEEGETLLANDLTTFTGGKGANQAVALSRLGGQVSMIGAVGQDEDGTVLIEKLQEEEIDISGIQKIENVDTGRAFISLDAQGKNTILVHPGANFVLDISWIDEFQTLVTKSEMLLMQLETPMEIVENTAQLAYKNDTKVVMNPAPGKALSPSLLRTTYLLTPNETELSIISGMNIKGNDDRISASRFLISQGVEMVVTTLGAEGALYVDRDRTIKVDRFPVTAVDTTAAGDSFTAGLALALTSKWYLDIEDALKYAAATAAVTITTKGAQDSLPYNSDVEQVLSSYMSNNYK